MSGSDPGSPLAIQFILLFVLILINAFFAAAEMAVVSVNKNKIKVLAQEGNEKAAAVQKLLEDSNSFLSTIQIAITLAGFLSSAAAAVGLSDRMAGVLIRIGIAESVATEVAVVSCNHNLVLCNLGAGRTVPEETRASTFGKHRHVCGSSD